MLGVPTSRRPSQSSFGGRSASKSLLALCTFLGMPTVTHRLWLSFQHGLALVRTLEQGCISLRSWRLQWQCGRCRVGGELLRHAREAADC